MSVADNRRTFRAFDIGGTTYLYYVFGDSTGYGGVKRYNESTDSHAVIYDQPSDDLTYGVNFEIDQTDYHTPATPSLYVFVCIETPSVYTCQGTFEVYSMSLSGASQTRIYREEFNDSVCPTLASDIILDTENNRWYFTLNHEDTNFDFGQAELSRILTGSQTDGTRTTIKTYENMSLGARSPAYLRVGNDLRIFYLEGGWLGEMANAGYFPTAEDAGHLIEIDLSTEDVIDHGLVWRSEISPEANEDNPDPLYDGWGVHTAFPSNMIRDGRDSLHFISGFGTPVLGLTTEIYPVTISEPPIDRASNYIWTQWGKDLSTKIPRFLTNGKNTWGLLEELAIVMDWEVGFGVSTDLVAILESRFASQSDDFGRNANLLFRPRQLKRANLKSSISSTSAVTSIELEAVGFEINQVNEFPVPPSGEKYYVIINNEIFSYTGLDTSTATLTGVSRGQVESTSASHAVGDDIFFIDAFATNEGEFNTLANIDNRTIDYPNLYNSIDVPYGSDHFVTEEDATSVSDHGKIKYIVQNNLLQSHDRPWAAILGERYLNDLSQFRELINFTIIYTPDLQLGMMVLLHQPGRINIDYKKMRVIRVTHNTKTWQTEVLGREIT